MKYFQCVLRKLTDDPYGAAETVAWIEERGAKEGLEVELKSLDGEFWRVHKVYGIGLDAQALLAKQANDRNALPSIVGRTR